MIESANNTINEIKKNLIAIILFLYGYWFIIFLISRISELLRFSKWVHENTAWIAEIV